MIVRPDGCDRKTSRLAVELLVRPQLSFSQQVVAPLPYEDWDTKDEKD